MEICLPGELEDKLSIMATQQGRDSAAIVVEAVERLIEHEGWFVSEVEKGLAQIEAGNTLSHSEVGLRLEQFLATKTSRP